MWKLLTFLPSLASGVLEFLNKKQDVDLEKYKVDGKIDEALVAAEVAIVQARASALSHMTWLHYCFGLPLALYYAASVFDAVTEDYLGWDWDVHALTGNVSEWSGWIVAFLFLHSGVSHVVSRIFRR